MKSECDPQTNRWDYNCYEIIRILQLYILQVYYKPLHSYPFHHVNRVERHNDFIYHKNQDITP